MVKTLKKKIIGKARVAAKRPRKKVVRVGDALKATAMVDGKEVFDPKRVTLASATTALTWDCIIDDEGVDASDWAKQFLGPKDDPGSYQRFFAALVSYINESVPNNKLVADLYTDSDGKVKLKMRLLDNPILLKRMLEAAEKSRFRKG